MSSKNIETQIRQRVDSFVTDLTELIRDAALETVHEALRGGLAAPARPAVRRGRKATKKKVASRGGRRSSADLGQLKEAFLDHVTRNPGMRLEQISVAMGYPSKELKRPVQLLLFDGKLRTEGQRRGTKYFAGKGKPVRKASAKKAGRKKVAKKKTTKRKATKRKATKK